MELLDYLVSIRIKVDTVPQVDLSTNWFFNYALPLFLCCFIAMGILPIFFQYTFLAKNRPDHIPLEE